MPHVFADHGGPSRCTPFRCGAAMVDMPIAVQGVLPALAVGVGGMLAGRACAGVISRYAGLIEKGRNVDRFTLHLALFSGLGPSRHLAPARPRSKLFCSLAMGAVLSALHGQAGLVPAFWVLALAAAMLLLLAGIDMRVSLLPDALTLPLMWLGLLAAWAGLGISLHDAFAGVVSGFLFLAALAHGFRWLRGRQGIGGGDIKLLAALGAWIGWQDLAWVLLTASSLGIAYAMLRQRRLLPRGAYPFGPSLALGGMAVFMQGTAVHSWFS